MIYHYIFRTYMMNDYCALASSFRFYDPA